MPIYETNIAGAMKPLYLQGDSMAKASDQIVSLRALSSSELVDFIGGDEKIWRKGDPLPDGLFTVPAGSEPKADADDEGDE